MTFTTLDDLDAAAIAKAEKLAACVTTEDVRALFDGEYDASDPGKKTIMASPLGAYFGRASIVLGELLEVIERQRNELTHCRAQVDTMADQLAETMAKAARNA